MVGSNPKYERAREFLLSKYISIVNEIIVIDGALCPLQPEDFWIVDKKEMEQIGADDSGPLHPQLVDIIKDTYSAKGKTVDLGHVHSSINALTFGGEKKRIALNAEMEFVRVFNERPRFGTDVELYEASGLNFLPLIAMKWAIIQLILKTLTIQHLKD